MKNPKPKIPSSEKPGTDREHGKKVQINLCSFFFFNISQS